MDAELEVVADRLRQNEEGYSTLQIQMNPSYEARDVEILTEAVLVNTKLEAIEFFGILSEDDVNQAVRGLFLSFSRLPKLRSLRVSGYCQDMVDALSRVIRQATILECLSIVYVQLDGGNYIDLNDSLLHHANLKKIHILDCKLPEFVCDNAGSNVLNNLLQTLARISSLRELRISPIEPTALGSVSEEALRELYSFSNLETIHIFGFPISTQKQQVPIIAAALEARKDKFVRDIRLMASYDEKDCGGLAKVVAISPLLESLTLDMHLLENQESCHFMTFTRSLQGNASIKELTVYDNNFDPDILEICGRCLEANYALKHLKFVSCGSVHMSPTLDFYLSLNRRKRGQLICDESSSQDDWVNKLSEVSQDLSFLFYFLSMKPSLCSTTIDGFPDAIRS